MMTLFRLRSVGFFACLMFLVTPQVMAQGAGIHANYFFYSRGEFDNICKNSGNPFAYTVFFPATKNAQGFMMRNTRQELVGRGPQGKGIDNTFVFSGLDTSSVSHALVMKNPSTTDLGIQQIMGLSSSASITFNICCPVAAKQVRSSSSSSTPLINIYEIGTGSCKIERMTIL